MDNEILNDLGIQNYDSVDNIHTYIHTYIRLLTTSPKGLFSANYKEKDKNKNIYKLFKVTIANH